MTLCVIAISYNLIGYWMVMQTTTCIMLSIFNKGITAERWPHTGKYEYITCIYIFAPVGYWWIA